MSAVEVYLTLASRSLISRVLTQTKSVTTSTAKTGREIRSRLELRESGKAIDKLEKVHEHAFMAELLVYQEKVKEETATENDLPPTQANVSWDELMDTEAKRYTIDDVYINWLLDELEQKDWRKVYLHNPNGTVQMAETSVSVAQMEAIADLVDALEKAKESLISDKGKAEKAVQK